MEGPTKLIVLIENETLFLPNLLAKLAQKSLIQRVWLQFDVSSLENSSFLKCEPPLFFRNSPEASLTKISFLLLPDG